MICKCGHVDLAPTITGIYTLPGKDGGPEILYRVGYTCRGCGTDGMILKGDATKEQVRDGINAKLARDSRSEMML